MKENAVNGKNFQFNKKEKEAVEFIENLIQYFDDWDAEATVQAMRKKNFELILNLIEKQQKEIEELKEIDKHITKETIELINSHYIHKDEIREKIKDLEKHKIVSSDEFTIKVLKDLIGE